jgi:hypothetical protein
VVAVTVTVIDWPGEPTTVKLPVRPPDRPIVAEPDAPLTVAPPAGTVPPLQFHAPPLKVPLTEGALPDDGLRVSVAIRDADDGWVPRGMARSANANATGNSDLVMSAA